MYLSIRFTAFLTCFILAIACAVPHPAYALFASCTFSGHVTEVMSREGTDPVRAPKVNVGDPFHGFISLRCEPGTPAVMGHTDQELMWSMQVDYEMIINNDFGYSSSGGYKSVYLRDSNDPAVKDMVYVEMDTPGFIGNYPAPQGMGPMMFTATYKSCNAFDASIRPEDFRSSQIESFYIYPEYRFYDPYTLYTETMFYTLKVDSVAAAPVPEPSTFLLMGTALLGMVGFKKKGWKPAKQ